MAETINQRIKLARKKAGLTQKEVAERLNMKLSTYSPRENKAKTFKNGEIEKIAEILNVSPNFLLTGEEDNGAGVGTSNTTTPNSGDSSNTVIMHQTPVIPKIEASEPVLSSKEKSLITMIRTFSKEDKDRMYQYAHEIFRDKKGKK